MTLLIKNIAILCGIQENTNGYLAGNELGKINEIENAWLLVENDKILDYGKISEYENSQHFGSISIDKEIDATDKFVGPTWCDSHTHLIFPAWRESEFVDRINGLSYEEIAKRGGGILNTAKKMQDASEEDLFAHAQERIDEIIAFGTGAVEIKSGYGLSTESELKMLRVAKKLKQQNDIQIKTTFLGAHALPAKYKENRKEYIDLIVNDMLPKIAEEELADYCDVFCDRGFFTEAETDTILEAGNKLGLKPKIHANELGFTGGIQSGVRNNAVSVDHLECVGDEEIELLANSKTMPTLLPSTAFFLHLHYPPARKMIDNGLPIALATDYNPGSSPSGNMPFILALACIHLKMTPAEAFNAATINGAYAMELDSTLGSITKNKKANFFISNKGVNLSQIPYNFGRNPVEQVFINGKLIHQ
ncbi:MAG: imidazolonepropionase [Bacteroidia bacterium]|nr:imidazolonepropionase [Bacteroidia bacterium]